MKHKMRIEPVRLDSPLQSAMAIGRRHRKQGFRTVWPVNDHHRGQPFYMPGNRLVHLFPLRGIDDLLHPVRKIAGRDDGVGGMVLPVIAVIMIAVPVITGWFAVLMDFGVRMPLAIIGMMMTVPGYMQMGKSRCDGRVDHAVNVPTLAMIMPGITVAKTAKALFAGIRTEPVKDLLTHFSLTNTW